MHKRIKFLIIVFMISVMICGCSRKTDPEAVKFKNDIENFCNSITNLDESINQIDASTDNASTQLLEYLDEVDMRFKTFAALDFPEQYDYLEHLADEGSEHMSAAVSNYHIAFSNGGYNENIAAVAQQDYSIAIKRVKIIISVLKGEEITDPDVVISYTSDAASTEQSDSAEKSNSAEQTNSLEENPAEE